MKKFTPLEKINHTICLNNLEKNIVWNIDKEEECDCESIKQFVDCYDTIEKELKALEIIKEKKVDMFSLLSSIEWLNPSHYNDSVGCPVGCELTQEEYDLLKEVLL